MQLHKVSPATKSLILVSPVLIFLAIYFLAPISYMLIKSVYHPKVNDLLPQTSKMLANWDEKNMPPRETLDMFVLELQQAAKDRNSGKIAEEINRFYSGTGSLIKQTARKIKRKDNPNFDTITDINERWNEPILWSYIDKASEKFTFFYYLASFGFEYDENNELKLGGEDKLIYLTVMIRTLLIAGLITTLTLLLGYPLSYYLSILPNKISNTLLIFVLLPFWISLLVRTTSWIVILQSNGVINSLLEYMGFIDEPLDMIYNMTATVIGMTHILLPFMVLPLYSTMKAIPNSYMRASYSLGAKPLYSFIKIYLPMTLPGVSAGSILVFIISIGYYITPALLGGAKGQMISNLIAFHMSVSNNWEFAAALGSILLIFVLILYYVYNKFIGINSLRLN